MRNVNLRETFAYISRMVASCFLIFMFLDSSILLRFNGNKGLSVNIDSSFNFKRGMGVEAYW